MTLENPLDFFKKEAVKLGIRIEDLIGDWLPNDERQTIQKRNDYVLGNSYHVCVPVFCHYSVPKNGRKITSTSAFVYKDLNPSKPTDVISVVRYLVEEFRFTLEPSSDYCHIRIRNNEIVGSTPHKDNPGLFRVGEGYDKALLFMLNRYIGLSDRNPG